MALKKIGINNPFEIKMPDGYKDLIKYWKGEASKPSDTAVFRALLELADNAKTENTVVHKDVVDAMMRQAHDTTTIPFKRHAIQPNAILFVVDYDLGRHGFAYLDNDTANFRSATNKNTVWNKGRAYRNDGVDIEICTDSITNGFAVTAMEKGEWLQYTVTAPAKGVYTIRVRARTDSTATVRLQVNGKTVQPVTFSNPHTKDSSWQMAEIKNIYFQPGTNKLRIILERGVLQLNYVQFLDSSVRKLRSK